ncbi:adenylate cyclase [Xenorhabdus sp. Flor]|nr:adenylate cyclase [Xenorhabdus sp. Flor]
MNAIISKGGASTGYAIGNTIKVPFNKILNPVSKEYEWQPIGIWTITKPASKSSIPSTVGNLGDSAASGLFNSGFGSTIENKGKQDEKK